MITNLQLTEIFVFVSKEHVFFYFFYLLKPRENFSFLVLWFSNTRPKINFFSSSFILDNRVFLLPHTPHFISASGSTSSGVIGLQQTLHKSIALQYLEKMAVSFCVLGSPGKSFSSSVKVKVSPSTEIISVLFTLAPFCLLPTTNILTHSTAIVYFCYTGSMCSFCHG